MAVTQLKDLGSKVAVGDYQKEHLRPALGNGTAIPGDCCGLDPANGRVLAVDDGAIENFVGIMKENVLTGTETAIVAGVKCSLIIPKKGHRYRVRKLVNAAALEEGFPIGFSATPYKMDTVGDAEICVARLSIPTVINDTICEVYWGE